MVYFSETLTSRKCRKWVSHQSSNDSQIEIHVLHQFKTVSVRIVLWQLWLPPNCSLLFMPTTLVPYRLPLLLCFTREPSIQRFITTQWENTWKRHHHFATCLSGSPSCKYICKVRDRHQYWVNKIFTISPHQFDGEHENGTLVQHKLSKENNC